MISGFPLQKPISPTPPRPHPTPPKWTRNGPGTDPKRSQTELERSQNGPKSSPLGNGDSRGGFVKDRGRGGGCKGKRISLNWCFYLETVHFGGPKWLCWPSLSACIRVERILVSKYFKIQHLGVFWLVSLEDLPFRKKQKNLKRASLAIL